MSVYFLVGLLTLLDLLRLLVSFCTRSEGWELRLWDWLYYYCSPWVYYGLIIGLDDRLWLWHITLHINESLIGTPCSLVAQYCWCYMLMDGGLGCYCRYISRLGCGLKARLLSNTLQLSWAGACTLVDDLELLVYLEFLFLLLMPFGISTTSEWEVSSLKRTSPEIDYF